MDAVWNTLGIAPTTDVATIRKAYAARLRVTRPDDDAAAYQRLREAYDAAMDAARWPQQPEPAPAVSEAAPEPATKADPPAAVASATPDVEQPPSDEPPPVDPAEIARGVYAAWREHGDAEIVRAWPAIQRALDAVPIAQRPEAARWCAELVLQEPALPPELVDAFAGYFDWGRDFRADQVLGTERAGRLRDHLAERGLLQARSAELRARLADLLVLADVAQRAGPSVPRQWRLWLQTLLAPPRVRAQLESTPPAQLRALGIEVPVQLRIASAFEASGVAALAAITLGISLLPGPAGLSWIVQAVLTIGLGMILWLWGASLLEGLARLRGYAWEGGRLGPWFDRWSTQPRFLIGAALPFGAALAISTLGLDEAGRFASGALALGYAAAMLFGVWLAWPLGHPWQVVAAPLALAATMSLAPALQNHGGETTAAALVALWLLASHALLLKRQPLILAAYRSPRLWLLPRTTWGWVLLVLGIKVWAALALLALVLTLPLSFLVASMRAGPRMTAAALWIAACAGMVGALADTRLAVLPAAGVLLLAMLGVQSLGTALWQRARKPQA